ncbi:MAG: OmpA family protein [Bacteroidetes bacterium]|nr:OmpA family protein [Bacteroidota bacterium]
MRHGNFPYCFPKILGFVCLLVPFFGEAQNKLNARLFYSKPKLHYSPSKTTGLNLAGYEISVLPPEDHRADFYGEVVYKNKKVHAVEDFFESPAMTEIQQKIISDFKKFKATKKHVIPAKNITIHSSVEIFYPQVRGFIHGESFAKVRLQLQADVDHSVYLRKKYETLYVTDSTDKEFEGTLSMTMEDGENVTVGMALRQSLDQFYSDLHKVLTLPPHKIILSGRVLNGKTGTGVAANLFFQPDSSACTSSVEGHFDKIISAAKQEVRISAIHYINYADIFDAGSSDLKMVEAEFKIQPVEKGISVKLKNILFQVSTTNLLAESYPELDSVYLFLKTNPSVQIELQGHTDNRGNADRDVELSQQRVNKIKNYLVTKGIRAQRIRGVGLGGTKPIAGNDTEEGRRLNRRVEFVIVKD